MIARFFRLPSRWRTGAGVALALACLVFAACDSPVGAPPVVTARDGGATAQIGGQLLWTFGDTLLSHPAADGAQLRSCTIAWANPQTPTTMTFEPLDSTGAPYQCIPFTAAEASYNATHSTSRIALWPGSVIPDGQGGGLIFASKVLVNTSGALNYQLQGVILARIRPGQTVAQRVTSYSATVATPGMLFGPHDPDFAYAAVLNGAVYVYADFGGSAVTLARAPLAAVTIRSAYQFWDGAGWSPHSSQAAGLSGLSLIPGALSVSYNAYLHSYLTVHSAAFANTIVMQTAPAPQGPWSAPVTILTGRSPGIGNDYAGIEHPELALNAGQIIFVSYYQPQTALTGQLWLADVTLPAP